MKEIAEFIRNNEIEYNWHENHFYVLPTYCEMDELKEIIPWGITKHDEIDHVTIDRYGVCINLSALFGNEKIEEYFPKNGSPIAINLKGE